MRIWRCPNVWHLDRLLSVPQIDLSARADRKMVIFYVYLRYFTKKSRLYRTDTQIKKKFGVQRKNLFTPSYAYLRICIFSKEITALIRCGLANLTCCAGGMPVTLRLCLWSCRLNHNISATQTQPYRTDRLTN
jgi:hypothetical protein